MQLNLLDVYLQVLQPSGKIYGEFMVRFFKGGTVAFFVYVLYTIFVEYIPVGAKYLIS